MKQAIKKKAHLKEYKFEDGSKLNLYDVILYLDDIFPKYMFYKTFLKYNLDHKRIIFSMPFTEYLQKYRKLIMCNDILTKLC